MPPSPPPLLDSSALKQTLRVGSACAAAFAAYRLLGLQQGYWAVFTVLLVMQGSIGGTLAAALDRMLGTLVGACLGALGAWVHDGSTLTTGGALVAVTAAASYLASIRPQLKVAPLTASIMMLTVPPGIPIGDFVLDRILEISIGGVIGVAAMALILPARSGNVFTARAAAALEDMRSLLGHMAETYATGAAASFGSALVGTRPSLIAVDQAFAEADREHAARLWRHAISPALPRTLWRVRSDLVLLARALDQPLPATLRQTLGEPGAGMLLGLGELVQSCAAALTSGRRVERRDIADRREVFAGAFSALRSGEEDSALDLATAGRIFGFSFALDELARDLADLADRIDEIAEGVRSRLR